MNLIYSTQISVYKEEEEKKNNCEHNTQITSPTCPKGPYQQYVTKRINIQCPWVTHDMVWLRLPSYTKRIAET